MVARKDGSPIGWVIMEGIGEPMKPTSLKVIQENGVFFVRFITVLQAFNRRNRNGREYDLHAMMESLRCKHILELMNKKTWFGHAGHPNSDDTREIMTIDPKLCCHRINRIWFEGELLYAEIDTLDDGMYGTAFTKSIIQGAEPAFSLRALAALTKTADGRQLMKSKAHIVTYDRVILPSHEEAYRDSSKPVQFKTATPANSGMAGVSESRILPVTESSLLSFLKDESHNIKSVSNVFEVAMESMTISADFKYAYVKSGGAVQESYVVNIEDQIRKEVTGYMSKLF